MHFAHDGIAPFVCGGQFATVVVCIGLERPVDLAQVVDALDAVGLGFGPGERG